MKKMHDWETDPERYLKDSKGAFILKADGTPAKKRGRQKGTRSSYNYHSTVKASMEAKKSIRDKEKIVAKTKVK
mgnify:FL=1